MPLRLLLAALALAAVTGVTRGRLEAEAGAVGTIRDPSWLPDGKALRMASFGQRLVASDVYWLRFVQYIGESVLAKKRDLRALYPIADIVTDLDPRYGYAYQVAGSNLSGLAHRYDEADAILKKGMKNVPDRWLLPWVYSVNKFLYEQDYAAAAEYARRAAAVGKRPHLALLAANLAAVVDTDEEYDTTLAMLDQAIDQAGTPELTEQLAARRSRIATWQALSRVERAIADYRVRTGRNPILLFDLVTSGFLPGVPVDPSGGQIVYDPASGVVQSTIWGKREPITTPKP